MVQSDRHADTHMRDCRARSLASIRSMTASPSAKGADRLGAVDGCKVHALIALVPLARVFMGLAVDRETATEKIGLDGLLRQIYPDLADAGSVQIVHVDLNRL